MQWIETHLEANLDYQLDQGQSIKQDKRGDKIHKIPSMGARWSTKDSFLDGEILHRLGGGGFRVWRRREGKRMREKGSLRRNGCLYRKGEAVPDRAGFGPEFPDEIRLGRIWSGLSGRYPAGSEMVRPARMKSGSLGNGPAVPDLIDRKSVV